MKKLQRPLTGLCVDGSSLGNPGKSKYRCVCILTQNEMFSHSIGNATANVAEFTGLTHAITFCLKDENFYDTIYTDSLTAMRWVLSRKPSSNSNSKYIDKCLSVLSPLKIVGRIKEQSSDYLIVIDLVTDNHVFVRKWITKQWQDNPADFGNKR